jgi:hypothetical protein
VLTMEPNLHVIGLYSWAWICTCWSTQVSSCGWGCREKFWWKRGTVSCLNVTWLVSFYRLNLSITCQLNSNPFHVEKGVFPFTCTMLHCCIIYSFSCLKVRYPVLLTPSEKQIARSVCQAFRQGVQLKLFLPSYSACMIWWKFTLELYI